MSILINWLLSALVIFIAANILPGVVIDGFITALIVALVIGIINAFIKPFILILTLPINLITLGLFTFVVNALLMMLVDAIVPGFNIEGFVWAFVFSILSSLMNMALHAFTGK